MADHREDKFDELRQRAEELLAARDDASPDAADGAGPAGQGPGPPGQTQPDILELIHELNIHQTELEIQNEELRQAQAEISALKQEFEELYEFAPCGYITVSPKGIITRINLTGAAMLGLPRGPLTRMGLNSFIDKQSRRFYYEALRLAAESGGKETVELQLLHGGPDGAGAHQDRPLGDGPEGGTPQEQAGKKQLWVQADIFADIAEEADGGNGTQVKQYRITFVDISERKNTEAQLQRALKEKDFLMTELNHRVKNNLAMVGSLVSLKQTELKDTADLSDLRRRIFTVGLVHEKLYTGDEAARVDCRSYVQDLLETIFSAFSQYTVKIKNRVAPVKLPVKMTSAIGLIINELATNAMKHGFRRDEENRLTVSLKEKGEKAVLQIESSGEPLPEDFSFAAGEGFGLALVTELVRQIDGNLEVKGKPSPEFTITFPWPEYGFGGLKT